MTNGMRTSEFWGKIIIQLIGVVVAMGWVPIAVGDEATQLIGAILLALPEAGYAVGRGLAKSKGA